MPVKEDANRSTIIAKYSRPDKSAGFSVKLMKESADRRRKDDEFLRQVLGNRASVSG